MGGKHLQEAVPDGAAAVRYQPYPEYKQSGVEWLGNVPEHWDIIALHYVSRLKSGESITALQFNEFGTYPVFGGNGLRGYCDKYTHDGDFVLIGRQGALCGNINIANGKFFATEHAIVVNPEKKFETNWMGYLLHSMNLNQYSVSAAQPGLSAEFIGRLKIQFPPLPEQQTIAAFLDYKTAKIDALIAKKKALLDKLAEKRTALISHAVTKGLDLNAPMRDSGIEWLGEIPAHWNTIPIKFSLAMPITDGPHSTPEFISDGIPFISAESVKNDRLDFDRKRGYISEEDHALFSKKYKPKYGDVYMVKSGATTGAVAKVETHEEFNIWSPLAVLRPHPEKSTTNYLFYVLKSKPFYYSVELSWSYGTQQNIGMGVISNIRMALPPIKEQQAITDYLDSKVDKIDKQRKRIETIIARLQEYRSALITNAVTGKIDVRYFRLPEAEELVNHG